jgi:hypothetical protein
LFPGPAEALPDDGGEGQGGGTRVGLDRGAAREVVDVEIFGEPAAGIEDPVREGM